MKFALIILSLTMFPSLSPAHAAPSAEVFVDMYDYAAQNGLDARFDKIVTRLKSDFDDVCGDTFCEGDFSNLTSLDLSCSVNSQTSQVAGCAWTFAGSISEIDPKTGAIGLGDKKLVQCQIKVGAKIEDVFATLEAAMSKSSEEVIQQELPNGVPSFYDQLTDCL